MHHPFFEEWKAREEARRLDDVSRQAWKAAPPNRFAAICRKGKELQLQLRLFSLRLCVSLRWSGR